MQKIKSNNLEVKVKSFGAELSSIKYNDLEYLWQFNPDFWYGQSPILFPIVGVLKDNETYINGQLYKMPNRHGFARHQDFKVCELKSDYVEYELIQNEKTLLEYPFNFKLNIGYKVFNNTLEVTWKVTNTDNKILPFNIGAHPAFVFDHGKNETAGDYYFELDEEVDLYSYGFDNGLIKPKYLVGENIKKINVLEYLSKYKVLILDDQKAITLKSTKNDQEVRFEYPNMPLLGLWELDIKNPPFVCIEPWYGMADMIDTDKDFMKKIHLVQLEPNQVFTNGYKISLK